MIGASQGLFFQAAAVASSWPQLRKELDLLKAGGQAVTPARYGRFAPSYPSWQSMHFICPIWDYSDLTFCRFCRTSCCSQSSETKRIYRTSFQEGVLVYLIHPHTSKPMAHHAFNKGIKQVRRLRVSGFPHGFSNLAACWSIEPLEPGAAWRTQAASPSSLGPRVIRGLRIRR